LLETAYVYLPYTTSVPRNKALSFCVFFLWARFTLNKKNWYKIASLKSMFQYKSNDTKFIQYNQVLVALFVWSKFTLECACALFLETEVVLFTLINICGIDCKKNSF
jgi:hypothetical protein